MQGDLISRSRVIENIWDVFNSYANDSQRFDEYETKAINNAFKVLQKQIENQPTAYDVEKVVAELKDKAEEHRNIAFDMEAKGFSGIADKQYAKQLACINAIEIVRNGGKE